MTTPEKKVKLAIKFLLDAHGAWHFSPVNFGMSRGGVPDFIICHNGRFCAVEAKAGIAHPTALQDREIAAITAAGGAAMVINEDNLMLLDRWLLENAH